MTIPAGLRRIRYYLLPLVLGAGAALAASDSKCHPETLMDVASRSPSSPALRPPANPAHNAGAGRNGGRPPGEGRLSDKSAFRKTFQNVLSKRCTGAKRRCGIQC